MTRWKLIVEYDGGAFFGWQRQVDDPSVQAAIERAIDAMTGEGVTVHGAGRTDAGVHGLGMAAHVDIAQDITPHRLREGINALIRPAPVSILSVQQGAAAWRPRSACIGRRGLSRIPNRRSPQPRVRCRRLIARPRLPAVRPHPARPFAPVTPPVLDFRAWREADRCVPSRGEMHSIR